jgi:hypothetical protein
MAKIKMNSRLIAKHLQLHIVRPVLRHLGKKYGGLAAEQLLVGTALAESEGIYIDQITGKKDETLGPAIGLWQIEPWVAKDLFDTYLVYRHEVRAQINSLIAPEPNLARQLASNLFYACAIARLIYYRQPEAMPEANDLEAMANYWKAYYNSELGKGTPAHFALNARPVLKLKPEKGD